MTVTGTPRYDGLADWYDGMNMEAARSHAVDLARLLGPGDGRCLDLGCGTGHYYVEEPAEPAVPWALTIRAVRPPIGSGFKALRGQTDIEQIGVPRFRAAVPAAHADSALVDI